MFSTVYTRIAHFTGIALLAASAALAQSAGIADVTVTGTTPTLTASAGVTVFNWTLSANVTSSTFSSPAVGVGALVLCENGTGGFTVSFPANFVNFAALASTAPNYCQYYMWEYDGTNVNAIGMVQANSLVVTLASAAQSALIKAAASPSQAVFTVQDSGGTSHFSIDKNFNATENALSFSGTAPTCAATNLGTGPSCTMAGSDQSGIITLVTGTGTMGTAGSTIATMTMGNLHTLAPQMCMIQTVGTPLALTTIPIVPSGGEPSGNAPTATTWNINMNSVALSPSTTYKLAYLCF